MGRGVDIKRLNELRQAIDEFKGGGVAREVLQKQKRDGKGEGKGKGKGEGACHNHHTLRTLAVCDVVGGEEEGGVGGIGSGPTVLGGEEETETQTQTQTLAVKMEKARAIWEEFGDEEGEEGKGIKAFLDSNDSSSSNNINNNNNNDSSSNNSSSNNSNNNNINNINNNNHM